MSYSARDKKLADFCMRTVFDDCEIRAIDPEKRQATFTAATEGGVDTWMGKEYLRMAGARLGRYRKNPVVLDTHNRFETSAVIGRADVKVEQDTRRLVATVTFANTERAENAWGLVRDGFLKALSVGFIPNQAKTLILEGNQTDGEGEAQIQGPARIVREWELFEISLVPVPADADALRRGFATASSEPAETEADMAEEKKPEEQKPEERAAAPAVAPVAPAQAPEPEVVLLARQIRGLAPRGLEDFADRLAVECKSLDEARAKMLAEMTRRAAPVGTPEPRVEKPEDKKPKVADIPDADFARSF